jgi:hypothetical protein
MRPDVIDLDIHVVFSIAEKLAGIFAAKAQRKAEARLRVRIAAARYTRSAYVAVMDASRDSPLAAQFVDAAEQARSRAERHLRQYVSQLLSVHRLNIAEPVLQ